MEIERRAMSPDRGSAGRVDGIGTNGLWWGLFMAAAGGLWLGDMSGVVDLPPIVVGGVFAAAGVGFAFEAMRDRGTWWASIPAGAFIGLGALIALVDQLGVRGELGAATLLAASGLGLVGAYVRDRGQLWAVALGVLFVGVSVIVGLVGLLKGAATAAGTTVIRFEAFDVLKPFNWVLPAAVLAIGLLLVIRALVGGSPNGRDR